MFCYGTSCPGTHPMQYPTGCPYIDIYCCRHPMGYCTIETRISSVLDRMSAFFTRISHGISHGISVIFIFWGSIFARSFPELFVDFYSMLCCYAYLYYLSRAQNQGTHSFIENFTKILTKFTINFPVSSMLIGFPHFGSKES